MYTYVHSVHVCIQYLQNLYTCIHVYIYTLLSCHVRIGHFAYEWVVSRMNESCHVWMSRVAYVEVGLMELVYREPATWWKERPAEFIYMYTYIYIYVYVCTIVISHMNEACRIWMRHFAYEWVMSHMNDHVTYEEVGCREIVYRELETWWKERPAEFIYLYTYMHIYVYVLVSSHTWMRHVAYEWVTSSMKESCHVWNSQVTNVEVGFRELLHREPGSYYTESLRPNY